MKPIARSLYQIAEYEFLDLEVKNGMSNKQEQSEEIMRATQASASRPMMEETLEAEIEACQTNFGVLKNVAPKLRILFLWGLQKKALKQGKEKKAKQIG